MLVAKKEHDPEKTTTIGALELYIPQLDFVESLELGHRHKDHVGLLAALDVDLLHGTDLKRTQLHLQLRDVRLKINESLADRGLGLRWSTSRRIRRAEDLLVDSRHRVSGRSQAHWCSKHVVELATFARIVRTIK